MTQLIQFEGCTVAVIAPEDLEALEAENATLRSRLAEVEAEHAAFSNNVEQCEAENDALRSRLAKAEALLRVMPGYGLSAYDKERWEKARNAFLAADSASGEEAAKKPTPGCVPGHENCPKCGGHGWLWREELDDPGDWDGTADDTKYSCDWTPAD